MRSLRVGSFCAALSHSFATVSRKDIQNDYFREWASS